MLHVVEIPEVEAAVIDLLTDREGQILMEQRLGMVLRKIPERILWRTGAIERYKSARAPLGQALWIPYLPLV